MDVLGVFIDPIASFFCLSMYFCNINL